ncbi:Esterase SG1 [Gryllus bimaculatus]|nr:Esterase SG1 [Gryllus bimaculatus]
MSGSVTVSVRQGALRGRRDKTPSGQPFLSFQGIPYAQPPVGHRRFKPPVPLESWTGIRDATKPGNQSLQYDPTSKKIVGDEDCLFLNVFTPRLPTGRKEERLRAVLVWIHGGAFLLGSGDLYGPEPLMEHDVVLVTINYRLGPLGFLGLGTAEAPGNAGLKDQTMALRWVKNNIHVFGGDPDNITIFGESAGGTSVHYQVLSPLSKGKYKN